MRMTVGIVTYERPSYLKKAIDSMSSQTRPPDELVIIDDSDDFQSKRVVEESRESIESQGINLIYEHREGTPSDGRGMTEARNRVLTRAMGDVIVYVDDDVVCPAGWLAAYEQAYTDFPNAAAIGGPAYDVEEPDEAVYAIDTLENQNVLNNYGECQFRATHWVPPKAVKTHHLRGVNMSFPRSVLVKYEGFNPVYEGPAFFEETDLFGRLWKEGHTIIYHPEVALYHLVGGTNGTKILQDFEDPDVWYWAARNGVVFRHQVFKEKFLTSIVRIIFHTRSWPGPLWKEVGLYLLTRDIRRRKAIGGFIDGVKQVLVSGGESNAK